MCPEVAHIIVPHEHVTSTVSERAVRLAVMVNDKGFLVDRGDLSAVEEWHTAGGRWAGAGLGLVGKSAVFGGSHKRILSGYKEGEEGECVFSTGMGGGKGGREGGREGGRRFREGEGLGKGGRQKGGQDRFSRGLERERGSEQ